MQKGLSLVSYRDLTLAKLHQTVVAVVDRSEGLIKLQTGGWVTNATCKAIRSALKEAAINFVDVRHRNGEVIVEAYRNGVTKKWKFTDALDFKISEII